VKTHFAFRTAALCLTTLVAGPAALAAPPVTLHVNCDAGRQIGDALDRRVAADRGLIIVIRGTCAENVTVERDNVVLRAHPSGGTISAPDAGRPAILVDGARRVTIEGLNVQGGRDGVLYAGGATGNVRVATVRNAVRDGARIERNSNVVVEASLFENNGQAGVRVDASGAAVTGSTSRANGYGVVVRLAASATLGATDADNNVCCGNTLENNNFEGLLVADNSVVNLIGNTIQDNSNATGRFGILLLHNSSIRLRGGNVVRRNGGATAGGGIFARAATVASGQGDFTVNPQTNEISANTFGVLTAENAMVDLRGGMVVSGNTFSGVVLDHGTRARIDASTISNNGAHGLFLSRNASVSFIGAGNGISGNGAFGLYCADAESSYSGNTTGVTGNTLGDVNCTGF